MSLSAWVGVEGQARALRGGELSAVELTQRTLEQIEAASSKLNAFLHLDYEGALAAAAQVDKKRASGAELGSLAGVPIAVKDNLCTRGVPTTCASKILEGYIPPYDAHVIEALRRADAVIIGKTNLDEFAMGSSNENSAFGNVRNPWGLEHAPGGSSGGSAASVAAGLVAGSLGSDTGGSVRQPAAFCGVSAIKPTYGRVSRYGLIAFASSLDQVGPFARSVQDAARLLEVIAGHDPRDATSVEQVVPSYAKACEEGVKGLKIGVVRDQLERVRDEDVLARVSAAIDTLKEAGAKLVDVELPHASHALSVYYLVATAEASSNLARFDGIRYGLRIDGQDLDDTYGQTRAKGFGPEVRRRIMLGTYALSAGYYDAFYLKAQKVRTLIRQDYDAAFKRCDALITPTSPTPAFKLGDKVADPLEMYLADIFTLPPSLAGLPALGTPCGLSKEGLPIGVQITARPFEEATMLRVGHAIEQRVGLVDEWPQGFGPAS